MMFGTTCSQAELATDILTLLSELMEINSMEQAGCERNKERHGRIMNYLVGEQQDLNT